MSTQAIVSKVWSFCNTLRDDGVGAKSHKLRQAILTQLRQVILTKFGT
jgi:hypothetical protein